MVSSVEIMDEFTKLWMNFTLVYSSNFLQGTSKLLKMSTQMEFIHT